jgi:hypothetical protein
MKADGLILLGYGDYLAYQGKLEKLGRAGHAFRPLGRGAADQPACRSAATTSMAGRLAG